MATTQTAPNLPNPSSRAVRRLGFAVAALAATVALVLFIGAILHVALTAREASRFPAPGELIDVGGHRLHALRMGSEHPGPTVVFNAGTGGTTGSWHLVQERVARFAPTLAFDRAGLGRSERGEGGKDADRVAEEMRALLEASGANAPYVLVGHSQGGTQNLVFADRYPDLVSGIVSLDAVNPAWFDRITPEEAAQQAAYRRRTELLPVLARVGALRLLDTIGPIAFDLPPQTVAEIRATSAGVRHQLASREEFRQLVPGSPTMERARQAIEVGFQDLPLVVLTRTLPDDAMTQAQASVDADLASRSTRGRHERVEDADHFGLITTEHGAERVAAAVQDVIANAR